MPLYKTISLGPGTTIYIWKVTETEECLAQKVSLTPNSQERIGGMRSGIHRRAYLSIRHLLMEAGYVDQDLYYDEEGKPHLKDGNFVSITHSHMYTGVIISDSCQVGIDIEQQREKILRIAHKYTPVAEYSTIGNAEALIRKLTVVWGAKESLYKIYAKRGLSFLHHIVITDFAMTDSGTTGEIRFHGENSSYDISFLEFDGFTCVYAVKRS